VSEAAARGEVADVAIVGMGPVGAYLANALGAQGLSVVVLERSTEVYPLPRAAHFDHEVMRAFQAVGLADEVVAGTRQNEGLQFLESRTGPLIFGFATPEAQPFGWHLSYYFHQPELEAVLRTGLRRFPQVEVRLGHEVLHLSQSEHGVVLDVRRLSDGSTAAVEARYLVGCDGARSRVREQAGIDVEDLGFDEPWLVVDVVLDHDLAADGGPDLGGACLQICDPSRPTTFVPMPGDRRRWEFMLLPGEDPEQMASPASVQALLGEWVDPDRVHVERQAVYRFHALLARRWRQDRVLLAGDAAHQMPPFLGQGMCSGIRDAQALAWRLPLILRHEAPDTLLDTYQSERAPHVRQIIETAVLFGGIICTLDPQVAEERNEAFRARPPVPDQGAGSAPEIGPGTRLATPPAGRLLPQPRVLHDGAAVRLDELLGPGFAVVAATGDPVGPLTAAQRAVLDRLHARVVVADDEHGTLAAWLHSHEVEVVVVRPDRYVFGGASQAGGLGPVVDALAGQLEREAVPSR
jgi:3-(3-hydroxy-phenyl)propionate hydroxylase